MMKESITAPLKTFWMLIRAQRLAAGVPEPGEIMGIPRFEPYCCGWRIAPEVLFTVRVTVERRPPLLTPGSHKLRVNAFPGSTVICSCQTVYCEPEIWTFAK